MNTKILMPALSPTMTEGNLTKWLVKVGQKVKAGDIIAEIETDKATMEVEAVDEGNVEKLLFSEGAKNILVKGGHLNTSFVQDIFVNQNEIVIFKNKKITTKNTHGTGCTLSSAITTLFSCGKPLKKSCELGTKYVNNALGSKLNYGKGHGPDHQEPLQVQTLAPAMSQAKLYQTA